jgi:hypothetical protein
LKKSRLFILTVVAIVLLLSALAYGYLARHAMAPVAAYEKGALSSPVRVLIATQGSAFKDRLVATLVSQLEQRPAYVKVIDVAGLAGLNGDDWRAIVIVHSWEFGKPPRVVTDFVARLAAPGKIVDVTTSGSGREKLSGVDVISSASVLDEVPALVAQINAKLDVRLAQP